LASAFHQLGRIDLLASNAGYALFGATEEVVRASSMEIYKDTPAGAVRRAIAERSLAVKGDAGRTVDAMISAADSAKPAPSA